MIAPTSGIPAPELPAGVRPSGSPPYWKPGEQIWWRYLRPLSRRPDASAAAPIASTPTDSSRLGSAISSVRPMTVVRDDAEGLVAWLAPQTPVLRSVLADGSDLRSIPVSPERFSAPRAVKRDVWHGGGILKIAPTGVPWSAWVFWDDDGSHRNWYINLEQVHLRDDKNVYTRDHVLDLVVTPDRQVIWKDEDELAAALEAGTFTPEDAERFEADARAVEKLVARWASPFCDGWENWRPDPSWPIPDLPPGYTADY